MRQHLSLSASRGCLEGCLQGLPVDLEGGVVQPVQLQELQAPLAASRLASHLGAEKPGLFCRASHFWGTPRMEMFLLGFPFKPTQKEIKGVSPNKNEPCWLKLDLMKPTHCRSKSTPLLWHGTPKNVLVFPPFSVKPRQHLKPTDCG